MKEFKVRKNLIDKNGQPKKPSFLGVDKIVSDIKEMPKWFKYFMIAAIVVILFFEFFNCQGGNGISFFEPLARYNDAYENGSAFGAANDNGQAVAVAVLYSLNGLASFTGILTVSLIVYNKVSQWFWQVINAFFFGLMAISVGYLGDLIMQVIILLGCPLGWYLYEFKNHGEQEENKGWKYNLIFAIGLAIVIAIVVLVLYEFLPEAFADTFGKTHAINTYKGSNGKAMTAMDSLTNGFNVVAFIMQVVNIDNQFMIWPLVDILKLLSFTGIAGKTTLSPNMIIEFAVWLSLASIGVYERLLKEYVQNFITKIKAKKATR